MSEATNQAPAQPKDKKTVRDWLQSSDFSTAVAQVLPKHLTPERQVRMALAALTRNPRLQDCTPGSVLRCMIDLSAMGLEPDGRRAHLIPFRDKRNNVTICTLIVDYKGLVEMAWRNGGIQDIHADVVCDLDQFTADTGRVKHIVNYKAPRGKPYAAYCIVRFKDGGEKSEVMTVDEIEAVRARSRSGGEGPWVTDWNEMAKKTCARRALKWVPLSPEIREAIEREDDDEPINVTPRAPATMAEAFGIIADAADTITEGAKSVEIPPDKEREKVPAPGQAEATPAREYTAAERDDLLAKLQEACLDGKTSEAKLFKIAKDKKLAGHDTAADLRELPAATLEALSKDLA